MIVVGGELVPLDDVSQTDKLLSSKEPFEHREGENTVRLALFTSGSFVLDSFCILTDGDVIFRLHLDCPVSRNPLANGLLSIFSFVMRSFCLERKKLNTLEIITKTVH